MPRKKTDIQEKEENKASIEENFARLEDIINAHEKAKEKGIVNSVSSCTLLAELGRYKMHIVPGEGRNIKITTTEDLEIFKVMLQTSKEEWLK